MRAAFGGCKPSGRVRRHSEVSGQESGCSHGVRRYFPTGTFRRSSSLKFREHHDLMNCLGFHEFYGRQDGHALAVRSQIPLLRISRSKRWVSRLRTRRLSRCNSGPSSGLWTGTAMLPVPRPARNRAAAVKSPVPPHLFSAAAQFSTRVIGWTAFASGIAAKTRWPSAETS
jgi:hypothetical protein